MSPRHARNCEPAQQLRRTQACCDQRLPWRISSWWHPCAAPSSAWALQVSPQIAVSSEWLDKPNESNFFDACCCVTLHVVLAAGVSPPASMSSSSKSIWLFPIVSSCNTCHIAIRPSASVTSEAPFTGNSCPYKAPFKVPRYPDTKIVRYIVEAEI